MSCLSVFAFVFLDLGIIACLISFCAPFWIHDTSITGKGLDAVKDAFAKLGGSDVIPVASTHQGLWGHCSSDLNCVGIWENDFFLERHYPDWRKASQGLFAAGVLLLLVSILVSAPHVCCSQCKESYSLRSALGSLTLAGVLCIAASLAIFGGFMYKEGNLGGSVNLDWGYWCGVAGVGACLLGSICFFFDSCCGSRHVGYHMTRVV